MFGAFLAIPLVYRLIIRNNAIQLYFRSLTLGGSKLCDDALRLLVYADRIILGVKSVKRNYGECHPDDRLSQVTYPNATGPPSFSPAGLAHRGSQASPMTMTRNPYR